MSAAKHTPGPWVACVEDGDESASTVFAEHQLINGRIDGNEWDNCVASAGLNHENYEANACLIAAAPELLEALTEYVQGRNGKPAIPGSTLFKARAAIAKATGASS